MFRRLWQKIRALWFLAKNERATPKEIFWAVFIGGFTGCTPAIGFHGLLAVAVATAFRKNRLFAWLGVRISNMVMLPFIAYAEVQIAHRIRTGQWTSMTVDRDRALEQAGTFLLDWCLGTIPVGIVIGTFVGLIGYAWAVRRDRKAALAADQGARAASIPVPPTGGDGSLRTSTNPAPVSTPSPSSRSATQPPH